MTWLMLSLLGSVWAGHGALEYKREAFETDACIVHQLLSQRAQRHDAICRRWR